MIGIFVGFDTPVHASCHIILEILSPTIKRHLVSFLCLRGTPHCLTIFIVHIREILVSGIGPNGMRFFLYRNASVKAFRVAVLSKRPIILISATPATPIGMLHIRKAHRNQTEP